ncbi:S41 family peptidase [Vallitalea sp.]|jgi:carboxyl-terminal processing protease|uniref:S41 family peptidase n=1 Tax=Vallitalea sp. TaxID=1882829 RepID=UPI0025F7ECA1|nr:S41 family peptidase [Vallitalea sp.]MCT4688616.1 S41 family peptidase [Vallitalea sp.]
MAERKKFIYGLVVGMAIILLINVIYFGTSNLMHQVEDNKGVQVVKEGYNTPEEKIKDILKLVEDRYYLENYKEEELYDSAYDGLYSGLLDGLEDPYTEYYTKKEYESFMESTSGSYEGIGAVVTYSEETKELMIVSPFIGSPAEKAGLLPGDIVRKVDDKNIKGLTMEDVVANMIRGKKGTKVTLSIYRESDNSNMDLVIKRDVITMPTVSYEMLDGKIGYIRITGFEEVTYDQFKEALYDLEAQEQKGLIIDVRNNPGGLLNIVIDMSDELLPKGLIVYTEDKNGYREQASSDEEHKFTKPLVVLANENSASASEILTGAIKDSGIGTVVGTTTFGKGLVQRIFPLEDGSAVKVTISKYYTPSGNYIHGKGIEPDVKIELPEGLKKELVIKREEDTQFAKAVEVMKDKIAKEDMANSK